MMATFQDDVSAGLAAIRDAVGESVTLTRGDDSVTLTVAIGRSAFGEEGLDGVLTEVTSVDFLAQTDEIILAGQEVRPLRGDTITWGSRVFEVIGGAIPPVHESDPQGQTLRIHTKEMGT